MSHGRGGTAVAIAGESREVVLPPYRFRETRAGRGTPVVLIHGLGGSSDWWRRNVDALASEHLAVAVDLVGFGRSRFFIRRSFVPAGFADLAALLGRWIESSFDEPVHLVGNSMGGHTAIYLAAQRPDLVRSLTLVDTTGIPFALNVGPHIRNLIVPRGALSFAHIVARDALRTGPASIALAFARLLRDDARPSLRNIRVPTLLLWGEHDPLVPLTYARQIAELIAGARLVVIPGAGHIPFWENAPAFNRELLEFLREADRLPVTRYRPPIAFAWPVAGIVNRVAYREAGTRRDIVLVHGLGMSSKYLVHLARALFDRDLHAVATDLPGFGNSPDAPPLSPLEHAQALIEWADALEIRNAIWIGHSLGGNVVAYVAAARPDLVREAVYAGPLWTKSRHPLPRLLGTLLLDATREKKSLFRYIIAAYWRTGFARWWRTFHRSLPDVRMPPPRGTMIAGHRDPLPDRSTIANIVETPGAHACVFSHPAGVAEIVAATSSRRPSSSVLRRS